MDNRTAVIKNTGTKDEVRIEYVADSIEKLSKVLMTVERKPKNTVTGSGIEGITDNEALQTIYFYYDNGLSAQENEKGAVKYSYAHNRADERKLFNGPGLC